MAPTPPTDKDVLETRQARKRELDRRAQRAARERNRNRIAFLEATIDAMKQQESGRGVAQLTDQLMDVTRQRDQLAETLASVKETIELRHPSGPRVADATKDKQSRQDSTVLHPAEHHSSLGTDFLSGEIYSPPVDSTVSEIWAAQSPPDYPSVPQHVNRVAIAPPSTIPEDINFNSIFQSCLPFSIADGPIIPVPDIACDCSATHPSVNNVNPPSSIWRTANEVLGQKEMPCRSTLQLEDSLVEDTPIRVILEGWDAVENGVGLPPLWNRLRQIDELQFHPRNHCHTLQLLISSYGMLKADTLWNTKLTASGPGVRERFVFSQHQYCSNSFWKIFVDCFKISWPFEFRDCYKRNTRTGSYSISPEFMDCIWDINSWTMTTDFFGTFPEMYSDIPAFLEVPRLRFNSHAERGWNRYETESRTAISECTQQIFEAATRK
ncbi:hypothetical protein QQZ08_002989 [Neonectria magnoliae]|uniref:BZIP domain-containing protein n=1 Tax=Neonectria magnoliae TaxID=2732573 RepID=A0ABR1IA72_9HYPO